MATDHHRPPTRRGWRRRPRGPAGRLAGTAVAAGLLVAGCGIPTDDGPIDLTGTVPTELVQTTTSTTPPDAVTKVVPAYLLDTRNGVRLVQVPRSVDVGAGIQQILSNLFTVRPDGIERPTEAGLSSAIPESATLLSATIMEGTSHLVVDVRGLFGSTGIQGESLRNALAQIVWTATETDDVTMVSFLNDGAPVPALVDEDVQADGPVDRTRYRQSL